MEKYYDPSFLEDLFDDMSGTYAHVNYITSFGFSERWRKQCVKAVPIENDATVVDLLTGMGECWNALLKKRTADFHLIGIDISGEMIKRAEKRKAKYPSLNIDLLKENVFENSITDEEADVVISGFGIKTFNEEQLHQLALEIKRILKPGGHFSMVDVSVPPNKLLRGLYLFYLKQVIPVLGKLFLGNPETYRMLGIYTELFQNAENCAEIFRKAGLEVEYKSYFYGCASGLVGCKLL